MLLEWLCVRAPPFACVRCPLPQVYPWICQPPVRVRPPRPPGGSRPQVDPRDQREPGPGASRRLPGRGQGAAVPSYGDGGERHGDQLADEDVRPGSAAGPPSRAAITATASSSRGESAMAHAHGNGALAGASASGSVCEVVLHCQAFRLRRVSGVPVLACSAGPGAARPGACSHARPGRAGFSGRAGRSGRWGGSSPVRHARHGPDGTRPDPSTACTGLARRHAARVDGAAGAYRRGLAGLCRRPGGQREPDFPGSVTVGGTALPSRPGPGVLLGSGEPGRSCTR